MDFSISQFMHTANRSLDHEHIEIDARGDQLAARSGSIGAQVKRFFTRHVRLLDRNEAVSRAFFAALERDFGREHALKAMSVVRPDVRRLAKSDSFSVSRPYFLTAGQIKVAVSIARSLSTQSLSAQSQQAFQSDAASECQTVASHVAQAVGGTSGIEVNAELESALLQASQLTESQHERKNYRFEAVQAALDGLAHACQKATSLLNASMQADQGTQELLDQIKLARDQLLANYLHQAFLFDSDQVSIALDGLKTKFNNDITLVPFSAEVDEAVARAALNAPSTRISEDVPTHVQPLIGSLKSLFGELQKAQADGSAAQIEQLTRHLQELKIDNERLIAYMNPEGDSEIKSHNELGQDNEYALECSHALQDLTGTLSSLNAENLQEQLPKLMTQIVSAFINAHRFNPAEIRQATLAAQFKARVQSGLKDQDDHIEAHKISVLLNRRPQPEVYLQAIQRYLKLSEMLPAGLTPKHQENKLKALSEIKVTLSDSQALIASREDRGVGARSDFLRYWSGVYPVIRQDVDRFEDLDEFTQEQFDEKVDIVLNQEASALDAFRAAYPGETPSKFVLQLSPQIDNHVTALIESSLTESSSPQPFTPSTWITKAKTYLDESEAFASFAKANLGYRNPKDFQLDDHFSRGFFKALGEDLIAMKAITSDLASRSTSQERESIDDLAKRIDQILQDPVIDFEGIWHPYLARRYKASSDIDGSH